MTFEELHHEFQAALRRTGLRPIPFDDVWLDLRSLDRRARFQLDVDRAPDDPLAAGARLQFRWSGLDTARSHTSEEDVVAELLGPAAGMRRTRTEPRWLRLDVRLSASTPYGKSLPNPSPSQWRQWRTEVETWLERAPLVLDDGDGVDASGNLRVRAWQGEPEATVDIGLDGTLHLQEVRIDAWQALDVARHWGDSRRRRDPGPDVDRALARVAEGIDAWTASLRHLLPAPRGPAPGA